MWQVAFSNKEDRPNPATNGEMVLSRNVLLFNPIFTRGITRHAFKDSEKVLYGVKTSLICDILNFYFYHKLKCCGNQWNKKGAKIFFKIKRQKITFAVIASERIRRSSGRAAARYGLALSKKTAGLRAVRLADKPFYLGCSLPEHLFLSVWSIIFTYRIG